MSMEEQVNELVKQVDNLKKSIGKLSNDMNTKLEACNTQLTCVAQQIDVMSKLKADTPKKTTTKSTASKTTKPSDEPRVMTTGLAMVKKIFSLSKDDIDGPVKDIYDYIHSIKNNDGKNLVNAIQESDEFKSQVADEEPNSKVYTTKLGSVVWDSIKNNNEQKTKLTELRKAYNESLESASSASDEQTNGKASSSKTKVPPKPTKKKTVVNKDEDESEE